MVQTVIEISSNQNIRDRKDSRIIVYKWAAFLAFLGYFLWASYYQITCSKKSISETTSNGYGFLLILFIIIIIFLIIQLFLNRFCLPIIIENFQKFGQYFDKSKRKCFNIVVCLLISIGIFAFLIIDTKNDLSRLKSLIGLIIFLLVSYSFSTNRSKIQWTTVLWGLILQFILGLLTIRWQIGQNIFQCIGDKINRFLHYSLDGASFVYGDFLIHEKVVFAFSALSAIYFLNFFINILYYYEIMQSIVYNLGRYLQWIMGTSICESVNSAANIFLGMSESPFLLRPYLKHMTESEIHSIMTSGFASVSGTVFAAYISFGANPTHLITSCVMSAPAALCLSKLNYPELEAIKATKDTIKLAKTEFQSVLDAASKGAQDAFNIVIGIVTNLIAFIGFIHFLNGILSWMGELVGYIDNPWSIELFLGKIFIPISYIMGIPWDECEQVGQLIGIKTSINEFVAFKTMSKMKLSKKSKIIATYAICGFSNPGSVGIMISTIGTLIPEKRHIVTNLVFRAFCNGAIVCFMTACIAGLLIN